MCVFPRLIIQVSHSIRPNCGPLALGLRGASCSKGLAPTCSLGVDLVVTRYEGRDDCALVVDGEYITVEHTRSSVPDLRVHQGSVTGVHFERATRFVSGIVTIAVDGAPLVVPTGTAVGSDPRTVVFRYKANDT